MLQPKPTSASTCSAVSTPSAIGTSPSAWEICTIAWASELWGPEMSSVMNDPSIFNTSIGKRCR